MAKDVQGRILGLNLTTLISLLDRKTGSLRPNNGQLITQVNYSVYKSELMQI